MLDLHDSSILGASTALGINNNDFVVGRIDLLNGQKRAFGWSTETGMIDLNSLLAPNSGWFLISATGINSSGQIVGFGTYKGQSRGFVLSGFFPGVGRQSVPEPASVALLASGAVMGLMFLKRRGAARKRS
jgi:probable HAF family extracellular repeat protein